MPRDDFGLSVYYMYASPREHHEWACTSFTCPSSATGGGYIPSPTSSLIFLSQSVFGIQAHRDPILHFSSLEASINCHPSHRRETDSMADSVEKPGAPSPSIAPVPSKKDASSTPSTTKPAAQTAVVGVKQFDRFVLRLNKLLSTPGGIASTLSTVNYALYILTHFSPRLSKLPVPLLSSLFTPSAKPTATLNPNGLPPVAALATLLAQTRTTLRLFGTLPLYAWLRSLLINGGGPKPGADPVLHRIAVLQASGYFIFQALENICVLVDHGIVSSGVVAALNRGERTTARVYKVAFRAWLGAILCDFLRLGREAQIEGRRREARRKLQADGHEIAINQDEEDAKVDRKWWSDLIIASAWLPMAAHFGSSNGIPGWNIGAMGVCGLVAGGERFVGLWKATA
ncbi:unnamed protein product [Periconia digitata]|uniref:Peroxin 11C n=1 Tax=Periconia digitata TaxID=1303443 RepID=A0A9W4UIL0_9PLEO|nr:unnamed protein product [Periconia digitata]